MPVRSSVAHLGAAVLACFVLPTLTSAQAITRSQNDPRPVAEAALRQGEISIDGRIDEAAWAAAKPITELVQAVPDEAKPPSQRTEIRILYDASALYVAARMYDTLGAKGVRSALA